MTVHLPAGNTNPLGSQCLRSVEWRIGKRVGRVVRRRDQPIAVVVLEHRRVAVADEDLRVEVLGEQRTPADRRLRMPGALREDMRKRGPEIPGNLAKERGKILLRRARDKIASGHAGRFDRDPETLAVLARLDRERRGRRINGGRGHGQAMLATEDGCPARIRTSIDGVRVRSLTIRRRGSLGSGGIESAPNSVNAAAANRRGLA